MPYTVEAGDTLSELAVLAGVSQEQVIQINCLASPELVEGQVLALPPLPTPTPCGTVPAGWERYTVQPGDTLFSLASRAGVSQEQVMSVNCLDSPDLMAGQSLYLPPLPTPTATRCLPSPPPGWVSYTVRPGDTLFSLAVTRGTTMEEVMRVNCLPSDDIWAGDLLYLPPLPFAYETPEAPPSGLPPVGEQQVELPKWKLDSGSPGAADVFTACRTSAPTQWVDMLAPLFPRPSDSEQPEKVQLGERRFFFACDFPAKPVSARMTTSDGQVMAATLLETLPNEDLSKGRAQAVVDWPVLPTHATIRYTLTITDSEGNTASSFIDVLAPTKRHILTVPAAGTSQTYFWVYYVNFEPGTSPEFDYCQVARSLGALGEVIYSPVACTKRSVRIDRQLAGGDGIGWAEERLYFQPASLPAPFVIAYGEGQSHTLFWLH